MGGIEAGCVTLPHFYLILKLRPHSTPCPQSVSQTPISNQPRSVNWDRKATL